MLQLIVFGGRITATRGATSTSCPAPSHPHVTVRPPPFFYCTSVVGFLSPWGCSVSNLPVFRPLSLEAFNRFAGRRHSLFIGALTGARLHLPACRCSRRTFPFGGRLHPRAVRAATCGLWQGVCIKLLEKILNSRLISFPRNK